MATDFHVASVRSDIYKPLILQEHYSRRVPPIKYAYALYEEDKVVGVVTFGPPASPQVARSVVEEQMRDKIIELNRLVIITKTKNAASALVGKALSLLPPSIVVSYADGGVGHVGYVYQATNFIYCGTAKAHDCQYFYEGRVFHPRTLASMGISAPKKWAAMVGATILPPQPKHRYVFFTGNKKFKRGARNALLWPIVCAYPKGETKRHAAPAYYEMGAL